MNVLLKKLKVPKNRQKDLNWLYRNLKYRYESNPLWKEAFLMVEGALKAKGADLRRMPRW